MNSVGSITQTVKASTARTTAPIKPVATIAKVIPETPKVLEFKVIAYPNPSSEYFTIQLIGGSTERVEVTVFDTLGRLIKQIGKDDGQIVQFGEDLPTGTYLAIVNQGANQKTVRLIKK